MKYLCLILLITLAFACHPSYKEARLVKVEMPTSDLVTIMGEPFSIEVNQGYEQWYFIYYGPEKNTEGMCVSISNNKVTDFYSY
jgi:hypothetical protein